MQFLGTAAADVLPNPFCNCPICTDARDRGDSGRLRSLFLLDEESLIDCGPDLASAAMRHRVDLTGIRRIFLTHTHEDHFCPSNAGLLLMSCTRPDVAVDLYCSEEAAAFMLQASTSIMAMGYGLLDSVEAVEKEIVRICPVLPGRGFDAGGYQVMPVRTTHRASGVETALNYRFTKNGRSILYACDTGWYVKESLELLRNSQLDVLVMEGTWGSRDDQPEDSHLHGRAFVRELEIFSDYKIIRSDTRIFCTHINHKHEWNHEAYQAFFDSATPFHVTVARDGMKVDL